MKVEKLEIKGAYLIQPKVHTDERGYFFEAFNKADLESALEQKLNFIQDNESFSKKGVFRGFSFQKPPYTQSKLVRVLDGEVLDFILDLREDSPTYGKVSKAALSSKNKKQLFIPKGCAHAFLVLSNSATFMYKVDNIYNQDSVSGVNAKSLDLDIDFSTISLNERDENLPSLKNAYKFKGGI